MAKYGPKPIPPEDRFWPKVRKSAGCWIWQGNKNNLGYGLFMEKSPKKELAHRVSYRWHFGCIAEGQNVLHRCDNPACVRPEHLFLGSMADNTRDMVRKGRARFVAHRGESNGNAVLTERSVRAIRRAYEDGKSQRDLAKRHKVSLGLISAVVTRRAWAHVV